MNRRQFLLGSVFATATTAVLLGGCAKPDPAQQILGRWGEEDTQRTFDFGPEHMYAIFANGENVETGVWEFKDQTLVLTNLTSPSRGEVVRWEPQWKDDAFEVSDGKAFYRRFEPIKSSTELHDKRLLGLWRSDGANKEILEFTPWGTLIGLFWRLDKDKELYSVAISAEVSRAKADELFLDGFVGKTFVNKSRTQKYEFGTGRLIWSRGRAKPQVFRHVKLADLQIPAEVEKDKPKPGAPQKPTPAPTP